MANTKKEQRIKLRILGNPVKLDGTITSMDAKGEWIMVEFDGPLESKKLYWYDEKKLAEHPREEVRTHTRTIGTYPSYWEVV
jgi:hypothetical protein